MIRITDRRFVKGIKKVAFNIVDGLVTALHIKTGKQLKGILTDGNVLIVTEQEAVKLYTANEFEVLY